MSKEKFQRKKGNSQEGLKKLIENLPNQDSLKQSTIEGLDKMRTIGQKLLVETDKK